MPKITDITKNGAENVSVPHKLDIHDLLDAFLTGKSPQTIQAYRQDLSVFAAFIGVANIDTAAAALLNQGHGPANHLALTFRNHLVDSGLAPSTTNRRLAALRSMVRLARTLGLVPWSLEVPGVKSEQYRDTRGPGVRGVKRILAAAQCSRNETKALRDVAIIRLLHDLALRRGEVVGLDIDDVDLENKTIMVKGKGRTQKNAMSLSDQAVKALGEWIEVRGQETGALFVNFDRAGKGARLSGRSVHRIIVKLGKKVGVKARPHGLRHTAITEAIKMAQENNISLDEVLDFSSHADVSTLMIYRDRERNVQGDLAKIVADVLG